MSLVIGLGIASDTIRAIAVDGAAVRWAVEAERSGHEPLATALAALLERCPLPRWRRPRAVAAVGPAAAQVKRVSGLPPVSDPIMLAAIVREGMPRFFLLRGVPLVTTGVRVLDPGTAWVAAFEAPMVAELERACGARGLRLRMVVPTAVALGSALEDQHVVWRDGTLRTHLTFASGAVESVRRLPDDDASPAPPSATPVSAVAVLGDRALGFADAYGATQVSRHEALSLRVGAVNHSTAARRRVVVAATALALTGSGALIAPGLAAIHARRHAETRLSALASRERQVRDAERELARVTDALGGIAAFGASRHATTLLLRDLAQALPTGSALVALQLDSAGGTLVALTPRAARVTSAMEHVAGISSPEIVGPVTRETIASGELERVTIHFHLQARSREHARPDTAGARS